MTAEPKGRWGVRFTSDPNRRKQFVQDLYDEDSQNVKRGELFLNEVHSEIFYVDSEGVVKELGEGKPVPFSTIDFTGLREFASDTLAAAATPPVAIGGLYHYQGVLRIRQV
jgi:hypothetical protein